MPFCAGLTCMVCDETHVAAQDVGIHLCPGVSERVKAEQDQLQKLKQGRDWQACPNKQCRRVYELKEACNHLTCACGTSFCYICGTLAAGDIDHWRQTAGTCPLYGQPDDDDAQFAEPADDDESDEEDEENVGQPGDVAEEPGNAEEAIDGDEVDQDEQHHEDEEQSAGEDGEEDEDLDGRDVEGVEVTAEELEDDEAVRGIFGWE